MKIKKYKLVVLLFFILYFFVRCATLTGNVIDSAAEFAVDSDEEITVTTEIGYGIDTLITLGLVVHGISVGTAASYFLFGFAGYVYWWLAYGAYLKYGNGHP